MTTYFTFIPTTRLGNWLFQYATALARGGDVVGYMPAPSMRKLLDPYGDIFGKLRIVETLPEGVKTYCETLPNYQSIPHFEGDVCLKGYFQCEKHFKGSAEKIRAAFAISPEREARLREKYGAWLSRPNVTGISVRRGDYLKLPHRYPVMNYGYFKRCFERLPEYDDFIVCSDDIPWCKKFFSKRFPNKRFCFSSNTTAMDDLYLQSLCQNNVISNSSFSWWGAWLNPNPKKRVLMPKTWYGPEYRHYGNDGRDVGAEGWEKVENHQRPIEWVRGQVMANWQIFKRRFYPVKRFVTVNLLGGTH